MKQREKPARDEVDRALAQAYAVLLKAAERRLERQEQERDRDREPQS